MISKTEEFYRAFGRLHFASSCSTAVLQFLKRCPEKKWMSLYMILIRTAFSGMRYENLEKHWEKTFTVAEENS